MATRRLDAGYRAARLFRVGDEVRVIGESAWLRIVEIDDLPGRRRLVLVDGRELFADPSFRREHRRIPEES